MLDEVKENKLIEIFVSVDDFCQVLDQYLDEHDLEGPVFEGVMIPSEILTIVIFYHYSGYKCFQYYFENMVQQELRDFFPRQVSYKRFLTLIGRCQIHLFLFLKWQCAQSQLTGTYFVDSKKLPVCHNRRIHNHKVFKGMAQRGKTSTGWFFGFKIHLAINNLGEVMNFEFSTANITDNNSDLLRNLLKDLKGNCYGDKGYLTKIFAEFFEQGLKIISKVRQNMKNKLMPLHERFWLAKRAVIESVFDILMTVFDIDHTRHRSPHNAFAHMLGALIAYGFMEEKPSVIIPNLLN